MSIDTIKCTLVTSCFAGNLALGPVTYLDSRMVAYQAIMLFLVNLLILGRHKLVIAFSLKSLIDLITKHISLIYEYYN